MIRQSPSTRNLHIPAYGFTITEAVPLSAPWYLADGGALSDVVAIYQPLYALNPTASYQNIISPGTHDLTPSASPPLWNSLEGWACRGTPVGWLATDITPTTNTTVLVRFNSAATNNGSLFGSRNDYGGGCPYTVVLLYPNGAGIRYRHGSGINDTTPAMTGGVIALAGANCYRDGVADGVTGGSWSGTPLPMVVCGTRWGPGATEVSGSGNVDVQLVAIYSALKNATQVGALSSAMSTYTWAGTTHNVWIVGDSKSVNYPTYNINSPTHHFVDAPAQYAVAGASVNNLRTQIDATLATYSDTPEFVLMNAGVNDTSGPTDQTSFENDYKYMLDAIHTKWPSAQCYLMRVWRRDFDTNCDTISGYINNVVTARSSFTHAGPDERVWMKSNDNGATYTDDGVHPNYAGLLESGAQWRSVMGY